MVSTTKIATAEWIQVSNAPAMEDDPEGRRIGWETLIKSGNEHEAVLIEQDPKDSKSEKSVLSQKSRIEEVRGRREKDETKTEEGRVEKSERNRKKARAK
ncbi:hypothetical protein BZA77DRAFT_387633 [Pyronema omphalodes]|nr:hypothetical protein BZA77DRAFT_387633 [Pyronema omphalodes]